MLTCAKSHAATEELCTYTWIMYICTCEMNHTPGGCLKWMLFIWLQVICVMLCWVHTCAWTCAGATTWIRYENEQSHASVATRLCQLLTMACNAVRSRDSKQGGRSTLLTSSPQARWAYCWSFWVQSRDLSLVTRPKSCCVTGCMLSSSVWCFFRWFGSTTTSSDSR